MKDAFTYGWGGRCCGIIAEDSTIDACGRGRGGGGGGDSSSPSDMVILPTDSLKMAMVIIISQIQSTAVCCIIVDKIACRVKVKGCEFSGGGKRRFARKKRCAVRW